MAKKLALVRWRDAYFEFDRSADVTEREDYFVLTVGWVDTAQEGPFLSVVSEKLPEDDGERAVTNVPRESVIEPIIWLDPIPTFDGSIPDWFTQEY